VQGRGIRLIACSAGTRNEITAQELANRLNDTVYAPTNDIWLAYDGKLTVANNGSWIIYKPQK